MCGAASLIRATTTTSSSRSPACCRGPVQPVLQPADGVDLIGPWRSCMSSLTDLLQPHMGWHEMKQQQQPWCSTDWQRGAPTL
jgi:hypothetical protein